MFPAIMQSVSQAVNFYNLLANHTFDLPPDHSFRKLQNQPINMAFNQSDIHQSVNLDIQPRSQPGFPTRQAIER
jgi:hypothetical protein